MKGYFKLKYDYYTDELSFGNLGENGSFGSLSDCLRGLGDFLSVERLIAHDVVEHSLSHRTKKYVTFEEELRAVGAAYFVRDGELTNQYSDILYQAEVRPIKPVPKIIGKYLLDNYYIDPEPIRYCIENGVSPESARNAVYQFEWGRYQKELQFKNEQYIARNAFKFIQDNVSIALYGLEERQANGVSVYFDTVNHIFRHSLIWRY